uniref:Uncharacterized protein n=1 Tax=Siphoviridae sp. ctDo63 TaxID=2823571 RepID=A0A8S5LGQ5_9CAUD|nr:MAG TPA: hypothetical protein [Siphoviridae sp. ctDo63]DAR25057.1 MAG TPA: hypothetical protein [Caudoviricetes sp.]
MCDGVSQRMGRTQPPSSGDPPHHVGRKNQKRKRGTK